MKKKSLKLQLQEIAKSEMKSVKGGSTDQLSNNTDTKLRTVTVVGKKKNISSIF